MFESGYYPAGAEHDPNAPWNQPDYADNVNVEYFSEQAEKRINEEISDFSDIFEDWLSENYKGKSEDIDCYDWYQQQDDAQKEEIRDTYISFRIEDVCDAIAEEKADYIEGARI